MGGCFDSSNPIDRFYEKQLDTYLDTISEEQRLQEEEEEEDDLETILDDEEEL